MACLPAKNMLSVAKKSVWTCGRHKVGDKLLRIRPSFLPSPSQLLSTSGRQSGNNWYTIGRQFVDNRKALGRQSGHQLEHKWETSGRHSDIVGDNWRQGEDKWEKWGTIERQTGRHSGR